MTGFVQLGVARAVAAVGLGDAGSSRPAREEGQSTMNKWWGATSVIVAAVALSGCSSSGAEDGNSSSSPARMNTQAVKTPSATKAGPATIRTVEDLRAVVRKAGVSCPDTAWKPNLAPDAAHATAEGVCADALTLVVFKDKSEVGQAMIRADLAGLDLRHALDSPDAPENEILVGPGWGALGADPTIAMIRAKLGGKGVE